MNVKTHLETMHIMQTVATRGDIGNDKVLGGNFTYNNNRNNIKRQLYSPLLYVNSHWNLDCLACWPGGGGGGGGLPGGGGGGGGALLYPA